MEIRQISSLTDLQKASFKAEYYSFSGDPTITDYSRRDFYKIWLIYQKGKLIVQEKETWIAQPALIFLHPLLPYSFLPEDKERSGYWAIYTESFMNRHTFEERASQQRLFDIESPAVFFPDEKDLAHISFLFQQVVSDYNSDYSFKYETIRSYINLLIHQGLKMEPMISAKPIQNAAYRITGHFLNILEKQYPISSPHEPLALKKPADFAGVLAVHVNHLNAVVHEITGKSTRTHIAERMISESLALLRFSDWSIAEIAYSLGFEYANHFSNFFKKHTGQTPLSLRKEDL